MAAAATISGVAERVQDRGSTGLAALLFAAALMIEGGLDLPKAVVIDAFGFDPTPKRQRGKGQADAEE